MFFKLNEIQAVYSSFNEDPKKIICSKEAQISGEGQPEILTLPAKSETKEAKTINLCTVITYYVTSITKQLKFMNSHCSIVCSYCYMLCA